MSSITTNTTSRNSSVTASSASSHPSSSSSSSTACASCKYQRRKCDDKCILAPFFPADNPRQFLNVHRLYGVANIQKLLKSVDEAHRPDTMRSIIFQSNLRAQDPVGGCFHQILLLKQLIHATYAELVNVRQKIAMIRAHLDVQLQPSADLNAVSYYNYFPYEEHGDPNDGLGPEMMHLPLPSPLPQQMLSFYPHEGGGEDRIEMQPPFLDVSELCIDSKNFTASSSAVTGVQPSSKIEVKVDPSLEEVQEHDLKSAASLFTLTNYNI